MAVGGPPGMPIPAHMLEQDMIGAIKIKDGLFIGDELASTVSEPSWPIENRPKRPGVILLIETSETTCMTRWYESQLYT